MRERQYPVMVKIGVHDSTMPHALANKKAAHRCAALAC
jgi:hypothetical protein